MVDDDLTAGSTPDRTQPLPPTGGSEPEPPRKAGGWRWNQVAVVAALALLLGAAGGALLVFLGDDDAPDDSEQAATPTSTTTSTTTSTSTTGEDEAAPPTPSTTGQDQPTTTVTGALGGTDSDTGGETAVGNSIFTGTYQSTADRSTGEFTVDRDWQIRWDVPVGRVTIEVYEAGGDLVEVLDAEGLGQRRFPEPGTYRVEIDTNGARYTVVITDGP